MRIRVGSSWYEYPDEHIKSWDIDGNIEWVNDKFHWKFLRNMPKKVDEVIPNDITKFKSINNRFLNNSYNTFIDDIFNLLNINDINSEISIIIPSKVLLEQKNGNKIDRSDFVIRFNQSIVKGYEEYVGSKTDLLVSNYKTYENIISGVYSLNYNKLILATPNKINDNNIIRFDYNFISIILERYNFRPKIPTAGLSMILLLVELGYKNINIYGFEHREDKKYTYYYKEDKNNDEYIRESLHHDYHIENKILISLFEDKIINKI